MSKPCHDTSRIEVDPFEGFAFLQLVPTWWDETRVVVGKIGEVLVTARRKGKTWYLGGINAGPAHDFDLPLSFLSHGRYAVRIWKDASDADSEPNHLTTEALELSADHSLHARFSLDGEFVAGLTRTR